jgi:hypothetical protein
VFVFFEKFEGERPLGMQRYGRIILKRILEKYSARQLAQDWAQ